MTGLKLTFKLKVLKLSMGGEVVLGGREGGRKGEREREGGRDGGREGGRDGEREREM